LVSLVEKYQCFKRVHFIFHDSNFSLTEDSTFFLNHQLWKSEIWYKEASHLLLHFTCLEFCVACMEQELIVGQKWHDM